MYKLGIYRAGSTNTSLGRYFSWDKSLLLYILKSGRTVQLEDDSKGLEIPHIHACGLQMQCGPHLKPSFGVGVCTQAFHAALNPVSGPPSSLILGSSHMTSQCSSIQMSPGTGNKAENLSSHPVSALCSQAPSLPDFEVSPKSLSFSLQSKSYHVEQ